MKTSGFPLFKHLIRGVGAQTAVELGCGAGVGTCAILDGLHPVVASFWLPFADASGTLISVFHGAGR
jgi:hypothetical protein